MPNVGSPHCCTAVWRRKLISPTSRDVGSIWSVFIVVFVELMISVVCGRVAVEQRCLWGHSGEGRRELQGTLVLPRLF